MIKIGEFSKLSHLTIKALRFYEKEGLLIPKSIDNSTSYRLYETSQLEDAAKIKSYRQLDLSIEEIKAIKNGGDFKEIFATKAEILQKQKENIDARLSIINHILQEDKIKYQVTKKEIPATIVYYAEVKIPNFSSAMELIPKIEEVYKTLNPKEKFPDPNYEFCEYLDEENKTSDILIRFNKAVKTIGEESNRIKFKKIPAVKVLSILHKGSYDEIGEAYAYIMKYADKNNYKIADFSRECYIDGIWNKESTKDWLTEIQIPIKE